MPCIKEEIKVLVVAPIEPGAFFFSLSSAPNHLVSITTYVTLHEAGIIFDETNMLYQALMLNPLLLAAVKNGGDTLPLLFSARQCF